MAKAFPWEEQYGRVARWYIRCAVCAWHPYEADVDKLKDFLYSFFENCWHLKEWLKHDDSVKIDSKVIEDYAGRNGSAISLSGDVATVSKHLRVVDKKRDKNAKLDEGIIFITADIRGTGNVKTIGTSANILATRGKNDALKIAEDALREWEAFFIDHGLRDSGNLMVRINERINAEIEEIKSQREYDSTSEL